MSWCAVRAAVSTCPSDENADGVRDRIDVAGFVACLVAAGVNLACADLNGIPGLDPGDVTVFVADESPAQRASPIDFD